MCKILGFSVCMNALAICISVCECVRVSVCVSECMYVCVCCIVSC